jgi:cob(I)alamin adenosyltransferase
MLYTGKGDDGTTKTFTPGTPRVSKGSAVPDALGALDEINSFLGLVKVKSAESKFQIGQSGPLFADVVHDLQETLFIVQAEIAGADKTVPERKLKAVEALIADIEKELPPITSFFISGGTELATLFDIARTIARRAERRVVVAIEEGSITLGPHTRPFLNRLSSILYALARLSNHMSGTLEKPPSYA